MKTPEELAKETLQKKLKFSPDTWTDCHTCFVYGYDAAKPEWISVKEGLPELNYEVIVAVPFVFEDESGPTNEKGCVVRTARLVSDAEGAKWNIHTEDRWVTNVTHWMPLPLPPEE